MHGHALKWRYPFAALNCFGHLPENLVAAGPGQHRYVLADRLRRRVAVQQLGAPVPAHNDAVRRLPDNGLLGRLDDGGEEPVGFGGRLALRDILLDGYEVGGCAVRVPNRRDGHLLDVKRAVLAPIDQLAVPDFALRDGSPEVLIESRVLSAGLEKARVLAHRFVLAVARHSGEGWVHILDDGFTVCDYDTVGRLLDRGSKARLIRFRALPARRMEIGSFNQTHTRVSRDRYVNGRYDRKEHCCASIVVKLA